MELNFDKEIDALLRQSAQGEAAFTEQNPESRIQNPKSLHLDADEISAFAENALPEKTRQIYVLHLADCEQCRKNLSSLILLNAEQPSETLHAEEKHFVQTPIPWYRKLYAVPNLAYTLGALVLVFSGIGVYTVLQSVNDSQNTQVSQTYEKQPGGKGMSSDGDQAASESYPSNSAAASNMMMSNAAAMNSSSNSAANFSAMPAAPYSMTNANAAAPRETADKDSKVETDQPAPAKEPLELAKTDDSIAADPPPPAPAAVRDRDEANPETEAQKQQNQAAQGSIAQNQQEIMPDARNAKRAPSQTMRAENKKPIAEESRDDPAKKSKNTTTTTSVGGKTFKRENNVWYDSAYRGQPTANVTRGTNEYKKLDAGLRGIAENLGGTVVVVWKAKAYRIQ